MNDYILLIAMAFPAGACAAVPQGAAAAGLPVCGRAAAAPADIRTEYLSHDSDAVANLLKRSCQ